MCPNIFSHFLPSLFSGNESYKFHTVNESDKLLDKCHYDKTSNIVTLLKDITVHRYMPVGYYQVWKILWNRSKVVHGTHQPKELSGTLHDPSAHDWYMSSSHMLCSFQHWATLFMCFVFCLCALSFQVIS